MAFLKVDQSTASMRSDSEISQESLLTTCDESSSLHSKSSYTVPVVISIPSATHPSPADNGAIQGPRHGSSSEEYQSDGDDEQEHQLHVLQDQSTPEMLLNRSRKRARVLASHSVSQEAVQERIRCVALTRIIYGDNHWQLAKAYAKLAQSYLNLRGLALQALGHAENARNVLVAADALRSQGRQHYNRRDVIPVIELIYLTMGQAYMMLRLYQKAEHSLKKAELVSSERKELPRELRHTERSITILLSLGKSAIKFGKAGYAQDSLEKALELAQQEYGDRSTKLIPIYQSLGHAEQQQGSGTTSRKRALEMYLHAHGIAQEKYAKDSLEVADSSLAVASAYLLLDEEESRAKDHLESAIDVYTQCEGSYSTKTIKAQDELCRLLIRQNDLDESVRLLKSLIESKSVCHGDPSEELANAHQLLGSIHLKKGKTDVALKQLTKCHGMLVCVLGPNHRKTKKIQETINMIKRAPSSRRYHSSEDKLKERPRFSQVVGRSKPFGATSTSA